MSERKLQTDLAEWLRARRITFHQSRMDAATTCRVGWPDFTVFWNGRALFLEAKWGKGKLSPAQVKCHAEIEDSGCRVFVVRDVAWAVELIEAWRGSRELPAAPPADTRRVPTIRRRGERGDWIHDGARWVRRAVVADFAEYQREEPL